jgi:hypothetical protein
MGTSGNITVDAGGLELSGAVLIESSFFGSPIFLISCVTQHIYLNSFTSERKLMISEPFSAEYNRVKPLLYETAIIIPFQKKKLAFFYYNGLFDWLPSGRHSTA